MIYWIDTEFIERGPKHPIELISVGIIAEDGREYYAISTEFKPRHASQLVKDNILAHLPNRSATPYYSSPREWEEARAWKRRTTIAEEIISFCNPEQYGKPEFWGYYADYDWVVLCQLFGTMMDLPKGWPMYCMDIKQLCKMQGDPKLPEQTNIEHHALADARWNRLAWEFLMQLAEVAA